MTFAILAIWFALALLLNVVGTFEARADQVPIAFGLSIVGPPILFSALYQYSNGLRSWVLALDLKLLCRPPAVLCRQHRPGRGGADLPVTRRRALLSRKLLPLCLRQCPFIRSKMLAGRFVPAESLGIIPARSRERGAQILIVCEVLQSVYESVGVITRQ